MSALLYYLRSVAGGHHKPGAVIWGPYTLEDAHGMQRVAANPFEIVPADQLSRDDLANLVTCDDTGISIDGQGCAKCGEGVE